MEMSPATPATVIVLPFTKKIPTMDGGALIWLNPLQGVRPKALSRITNRQLADFVCHCIQPRESRPRSRQLLKNHYFDSIRAERLTLKLGAEALGIPVPKDSEAQPELTEYATSGGSNSSSVSRTSSAAGKKLIH